MQGSPDPGRGGARCSRRRRRRHRSACGEAAKERRGAAARAGEAAEEHAGEAVAGAARERRRGATRSRAMKGAGRAGRRRRTGPGGPPVGPAGCGGGEDSGTTCRCLTGSGRRHKVSGGQRTCPAGSGHVRRRRGRIFRVRVEMTRDLQWGGPIYT